MSELSQLLTIAEMAALSRESRRTIERRISDGKIEVVRLSRRAVRIPRESAVRYLNQLSGPGDRVADVHQIARGPA